MSGPETLPPRTPAFSGPPLTPPCPRGFRFPSQRLQGKAVSALTVGEAWAGLGRRRAQDGDRARVAGAVLRHTLPDTLDAHTENGQDS